ncbi:hypothetical protein BH23THE1_BH23THE1_34100 [soil metagenome]
MGNSAASDNDVDDVNQKFLWCCKFGYLDGIQSYDIDQEILVNGFKQALANNHLDILKLLRPHIHQDNLHNSLLDRVNRDNQLPGLKYLIDELNLDLSAHAKSIIRQAALQSQWQIVTYIISHPSIKDINMFGELFVLIDDIDIIRYLASNQGFDVSFDNNYLLSNAISNRKNAIVRIILEAPSFNPIGTVDGESLAECEFETIMAVLKSGVDIYGNLIMVEKLTGDISLDNFKILFSEPIFDNFQCKLVALNESISHGNIPVFDYLYKYYNLGSRITTKMLISASKNGHCQMVQRLLLILSHNLSEDGCDALIEASNNSHISVVMLLFDELFTKIRCSNGTSDKDIDSQIKLNIYLKYVIGKLTVDNASKRYILVKS